MNRDWYRDFFGRTTMDFWRDAIPAEQTRREVDFLERTLRLPPGARLLDVPCGAGRLALPLAARGYRVTGVDLSPEAIDDAQRRSAAEAQDVEWRQADMRDLGADAGFDGALSLGNSFGYLDREGTRAFFAAVARALRPDARFVMDTGMTAESLLPRLQEREETRIADFDFIEENRYYVRESCLETTYTFVRGGRSHTGTALHWIYTVAEVVGFASAAGLRVDALLRSLDGGEPFVLGAPLLLLVATRGGPPGGGPEVG